MCIFEDCTKRSCYNYETEEKAQFCSEHRKTGMINLINKTCLDCKKQPVYNKEGETNGLYCFKHKKEGMIDVKSKTCIYPDCKVRPVYNKEGETNVLYCLKHKKEGMINVKDKLCIHPDCKVRPNYNKEGETNALYCFNHKKEGMVNIWSKTCLDCNKTALFNFKGELSPLYCTTHKLSGMVDIKHKTCKTHLCQTRVKEKYDGYCLYCYINLFPEKPVSRNYKTKEYAVVEFIKTSFPELSWVSDKKITDGCSKRRPDLFLDLGYQILIIEIDENQHLDYDCSCENKRIMELSQDVGHKPIVFIRFNPDEYYNEEIRQTYYFTAIFSKTIFIFFQI
jgi:hypothetical protein